MDRAQTTLAARQVLHILLVEDDDADAFSVEEALSDAGYAYTVERARTEDEFRTLLSSRFDIIVADWRFSGPDGMRASELVRECDIDVPLIFISAQGGKKDLLSREPYLVQVLKNIGMRKEEAHNRHVAEMRLARARRAQQVLLDCNRAVAHQRHEQQLLDEVCRILVASGDYVQAWIGLAVHDAGRTVVPAACAGFDGTLQRLHCSWGSAAGDSVMGRVIASGSAHVARDILNDPEFAHRRARARERGFQASLTLPLQLDGVCIGGLSIYAREADAYEQEELNLLAALAKDLAYGMGALRKEAARREAESQLARVLRARRVMAECTHAIIHATDEPALLREMCRIMVESGGYLQAWIGFATGSTKRTVRAAAQAGFGGGNEPMGNPLSWDEQGRYSGPISRVIASGEPMVARDIHQDPAEAVHRARAAQLGYQSFIIVPLVSEKRILGAMSIHARERDAFDDEEIELIIDLAGDLAFGITALRTRVAREHAERQLQVSEHRYRETFNQAAVGITRVDLNGVLIDVNQKFCDMLGYTRQELVGRTGRDITYPDDFGTGARLRLTAAHGGPRSGVNEKRYLHKDGRAIWVRRTMSVALDDEQRAQYIISIVEDITARKALEQRFEATFNQAAVGIMHSSLERRVLLVNRRLCEMLGYTAEELSNAPVQRLHHPLDAHADTALEEKLLAGEIGTFSLEKRYICRDGRVIWCRRTVSIARDAEASPQYFIGVFEDITERKEAEERYRATVQQAPVGIVQTALDGRILQVNPRFCEIVGYDEIELARMKSQQLVHPADEDVESGSELRDLLQGKAPSSTSDKRLLRKDGGTIWVRRTAAVVRDTGGAPLYLVRIVADITETKEAEERYRATFDNAPMGLLHSGIEDDCVLRVNCKLCEILGYSREELLEMKTSDLLYSPERRTDRAHYFEQMLSGEAKSYSSERLFRRKDGTPVWTSRTVSLVRDAADKPLYFIRIIEDISERKRAEHALQRTSRLNTLLRALATAANEAVTPEQAFRACLAHLSAFSGWVLGRVVIFGKTEADYDEQLSIWHGAEDGRWAPFREVCEPFFLVRESGLINRVLETGQPLWLEALPHDAAQFRRAAAAQACGLCSALAFPVIAAGRSYALIELYADRRLPCDAALLEAIPHVSTQLARVAERRFAENALLESERFARATMDALSQHICVVDEAGAIIAANKSWRAFAESNGYSASTVWAGENFFRVSDKATGMSSAEVLYVASGIGDVLAGVQDEFTTEYSCRSNAEQRWFSVKAKRFPGDGPRRAVISYEDITDRALSHRRRAMEHAVTSVLAESASLSEAMSKLIRTMCEAMDWTYGALWSWDEEQGLRRLQYWSEAPLELDAEKRACWEALGPDAAGGLLRRGLNRREPTWIVDVQSDPNFARCSSAQELGFVSAYAFPIFAANKVIGMMEFFGRDVRQPDEMLLLITRSVGSQIGQYIQRKEAEQALRMSEERFRVTISQAAVGITVTGLDLRYAMANQKYCEIMGYTQEELGALSVKDVVRPEDYEETLSFRRRMLEGESGTVDREKQLVRKDGSLVWVMLSTSLVRDEKGEAMHYISVIQDISGRKRVEIALRESEEKFVQLSTNIPQAFWISDAALKETVYMSPACAPMLGVSVDELKRNPRLLVRAVHREDRARVYHARKSAALGQYDEIYRIVRPDGTVRWVQDRAFPVREGDNPVHRVAGIAEDITHRKEAEEKLLYLAHYDALTGLPNRNMFYDRLTQAMAQARRRNKLVAVMFLDLDRFKVTNDTLGHSAGDELLIQVARRLSDRVRIGDTVGRFGGDEFGLILSDLRSVEDGRAIAEKIMGAFEAPFPLERSEVYVSGSIGISMYPADSDDEGVLMKNADAAMYRAKEAGRNNYQFYTAEMNERALHRLDLENSLRRALERREFIFHYQPKVELATGRITGVEALLRWERPGRGMVQPAEFVPLLEDSGLIMSIGEWLLGEACMQMKSWERAGATPVPVAINLSARQFASKDLGQTIRRVLDHHGIAPERLQLELTESALMTNTDDAVQMLRYLKSLGVHLSIDDFGTGYSSLTYLQLFPIDALKIDRSFVKDITNDVNDATIVRAVIGMAHNLGLRVVAEGVETEAQLAFLIANGCDEMQGFYYSPPLLGEHLTALLLDPPSLRIAGARGYAASD